MRQDHKCFRRSAKSLGLLNNQVEETYGGHTIVKTFNHTEKDQEVFEKENQNLYAAGWKAQFISAIIMPLMNFVKNLGYVFVAVLGGVKVANGNMTLGMFKHSCNIRHSSLNQSLNLQV